MLKGRLKKEFFEWTQNKLEEDNNWGYHFCITSFEKIPFEMQKGVYEAFLKYKDYRIEIVFGIDLKTSEFDGYDWSILKIQKNLTVKELYSGWNEFENEVFQEAINKLNEILG